VNWSRTLAILRTDLRQLRQSKDFWIPMAILAALFFVLIPTVLLLTLSRLGNVSVLQQVVQAIELLPERVQSAIPGTTPEARASYAMAVYLFAPLAIVVPLTISTAVGANIIVGETERGTGEFLAHSPATEREIFTGKLIASVVPGYLATVIGFGIYALIVNTIVGGELGGWFFPTADWWLLMFWVVPPFIILALSLVVRVSARVRSAAAAQQTSGLITLPLILISAGQAGGSLFGFEGAGWYVGGLAWLGATLGVIRGPRTLTRERLLGVQRERGRAPSPPAVPLPR
jgi:ABC-type Na+ efflux pump permease subunit